MIERRITRKTDRLECEGYKEERNENAVQRINEEEKEGRRKGNMRKDLMNKKC